MLASYTKTFFVIFSLFVLGACASKTAYIENLKPIDNPFGENKWKDAEGTSNITLRTKRGDQSVEVELPNKYNSDLEVPMNPTFASTGNDSDANGIDYKYSNVKSTMGDREITSTFAVTGSPEDEKKKREIEQSLGLQESDELPNMDQSYLAKIDVVKQLFRNNRNEATLIEIDKLIKDYPTNAKLYEMRGSVLDRLGYRDLALRSWKQSLEFKPGQLALKKIVDRREMQRGVASDKSENK